VDACVADETPEVGLAGWPVDAGVAGDWTGGAADWVLGA
jgi:hypothetical protein